MTTIKPPEDTSLPMRGAIQAVSGVVKSSTSPASVPNNILQSIEAINASGVLKALKIGIANPKSLKLLDKNARYMENYQYRQLLDNIKKDGHLASTPFCHLTETGEFIVLSGNHRVKAAIDAGLESIIFLYRDDQISHSERIAIQLSHNALVGRDDMQILSSLWAEIEDLEAKIYAGLDSDLIEELGDLKFTGLNAPRIPMESIALLFLPEEVERMDNLFEAAQFNVGAKTQYLCAISGYKTLFEMLISVKKTYNIKNTAVVFLKVMEWAEIGRIMEEAKK
jgi:hypothetical protein